MAIAQDGEWLVILQGDEAGQGYPVVLLHGLFGAAANLGLLQRRLAPHHRCLALDLRNHGASPHVDGMDYAAMAADVAETLVARGAWPAALMGHSMGGKVAMRLALERPDLVTRLLVSDIAPKRYVPHFRSYAAAMLAMPPGLARAEADASLAEAVPDRAVRSFLLRNYRGTANPPWRIGLAQIAAGLPQIEGWDDPGRRYEGPALFAAGALSDYIGPEDRAAIRTAFPAARFASVKNAGHWVHADNPEGFISVMEAFLAPLRADHPAE